MSDDLVRFSVPAAFVAPRVHLDSGELAYGYARGWLDEAATVSIAEGLVVAGVASAPIEELASLFKDDLWRVQQVVDEIESDPDAEPARVWLYLALAWLHDHKHQYADPLQTIEMLYSDFGYPTEIEGLVRFMPPPPGSPTGVEAVEARWTAYLRRRADEYAARRRGGEDWPPATTNSPSPTAPPSSSPPATPGRAVGSEEARPSRR